MAMKLFEPKTAEIVFADGHGSVTVRGLSWMEILDACKFATQQMAVSFDLAVKSDPRELLQDRAFIRQLTTELLTHSPQIMTRLITVAADVPDQEDEVSRLPIDVQVATLEQIALLSFDSWDQFVGLMKRMGDQASDFSSTINGKRH